jgi:hypothetical protein
MEIRLLGNQMSWPHIFNVTILDPAGNTYTYRVMSWLSDAKAIALAVKHHATVFPAPDERGRAYDVRVERVGPAPSDERGAVDGEGVDVLDRMEF